MTITVSALIRHWS